MITSQTVFILDEIKRRIIRKENMRMTKMANSSFGSSIMSLKIQEMPEVPNVKPDFGLNSTKDYIFSSSVFAFDTILHELKIK